MQIVICVFASLVFSAQVFAEEITLNLKDADIRALISTVSKFTGKNFIIDPRVKAKITVISSNTMSPDEVYEVFLSILQVHGYAAVTTGTVIKIVPEVNAKQGTVPLVLGKSSLAGDELITKIIRLDHVPAAQLVPILRPLVPQGGHLASYNPTNTLIITDHAGNIQRLLKIIDRVDRPDSNELEIIQLKHASASEMVRIVNSLFPGLAKADAKSIKLAADDRTNSVLMSGDRSMRLKVRSTILNLDTPLEGGGNTHVIYLKYAKAETMAKILTGIKSNATGVGSSRGKIPKQPSLKTSGNFLTKNTIIQADNDTNSLIITADPNTLNSLKSVIRQLDIRRAQVHIEAIIAEISTTRDSDIGVGMVVDGTQTNEVNVPIGISNFGGLGGILSGIGSGDPTALAGAITPGLTLGLGTESSSGARFGLLLRALASDSATDILSTPSIVTLDNEEAEIIVGKNLPFVTGQFTNTGSTNPSNPFQTIERQDVGLTLKVTPQINDGDTIKLELEQEVSDVIGTSDISGPTTRKRKIKTTVLVEDGGILVLGGLIEESVTETETKIPLLGDIPLIGALFRSSTTTVGKQNLMVFLRPTILRDDADTAFKTQEKYNLLRSLQLKASEDFDTKGDETVPILEPLQPVHQDKSQAIVVNPEKDEEELEQNIWDGDGWNEDDEFS